MRNLCGLKRTRPVAAVGIVVAAGVLAGRTGHGTTKKRPARTQAATIRRTEIPISALLLWEFRSRPPGEGIPPGRANEKGFSFERCLSHRQ